MILLSRKDSWVGRHFSKTGAFLGFLFSFFLNNVAQSATEANTTIQNQATVSFTQSGSTFQSSSNYAAVIVDEVISLNLTSNNVSGASVQSPSIDKVLSFTLHNTGNGSESFSLILSQLSGDNFDVSSPLIYLDTNGNGLFDPLSDALYSSGANDPTLSSGESLNVFVVSDVPSALVDGNQSLLSLRATSKTGSGPVGTSLPGVGDGGVYAVIGSEGGTFLTQSYYVISSATANFAKRFSILDPDGGNAPIANAVVTYELETELTGVGSFTNMLITDPIPAGSTYIAGSLKLNGNPLTDANDADVGTFNGTEIRVDLGTLNAPATQRVTFQVRIQ